MHVSKQNEMAWKILSFNFLKDLRACARQKLTYNERTRHNATERSNLFPDQGRRLFYRSEKFVANFVQNMGNCYSRPCCTAGDFEETSPKRSGSEKNADLEKNSYGENSVRMSPHSVGDRLKRVKKLFRKRKSKAKKTEEQDQSKEVALQLRQTIQKEADEKVRKASEITLTVKENAVKQGASTSSENPSSSEWSINHPFLSDLISFKSFNADKEDDSEFGLFGRIKPIYTTRSPGEISGKLDLSQELDPEIAACMPEGSALSSPAISLFQSQELDPEIAACLPEGSALSRPVSPFHVSPVRYFVPDGDAYRTSSSEFSWFSPEPSEPPSPRVRARTRVFRRRRNNSVEGMVSSSGSEGEDDALPQVQTPTPSPETPADRRRRSLRTIFERIAQRNRSNRVNDVASRGYPQSTNNSATCGHPQSSNSSAIHGTPQASRRSPLMRAWLNILGRSPPPSTGRATQNVARPNDEGQTKKGCKLIPMITTEVALTVEQEVTMSASADQRSWVDVSASPSPPQSSTSSVTSFECEDDIEICSLASNSNIGARPSDFGGT